MIYFSGLRALDKFSHSDPLCVVYTKVITLTKNCCTMSFIFIFIFTFIFIIFVFVFTIIFIIFVFIFIIYIQTGLRGEWSELGRTETIKNCGDPEWQQSFNINYYFHQKQSLRFCLYDEDGGSEDLSKHDNLGTAECSLANILAAPHHRLSLNLSPYKTQPGDCGVLEISAVQITDGTRDKVTIGIVIENMVLYLRYFLVDLTAQNLDKKDLFSESDPFYCIYRQNDDNSRTLVYRSEWKRNNASPGKIYKYFSLSFT